MAPRDKEEKVRAWPELVASGCLDQTISAIVKGVYQVSAANHGKPVYKKREKAKGLDVLIYFWDDRDGLELCGWWFGPAVGGDQVWAFHPSRASLTPPANEWNVPNDGAIDATFTISARMPGTSTSSKSKAVEAPVDDAVRQKLELMKKEQTEFESRMKEIQRRGEDRRRREEELRKRLLDADGEAGGGDVSAPSAAKRPRGTEDAASATARLEEETRKLSEEVKRRKLDDEARHRAEEEARKRRAEEEEEKRRRAERRKREDEEEHRRREIEQVRRKEEDDRRRREEAQRQGQVQRRLNEEAKKRKEEISVLGVLEAMSRMAFAVPEDFPALKVMLDRVMETLLPSTGKQRASLKAEAERVLKSAQAYVEQAAMLRDDWEEWYDLRQQMPVALQEL